MIRVIEDADLGLITVYNMTADETEVSDMDEVICFIPPMTAITFNNRRFTRLSTRQIVKMYGKYGSEDFLDEPDF